MDNPTETQSVAAEIEATHGALEADALEARVEAQELIKEAMKETVQVPIQEAPPVSVPLPQAVAPIKEKAATPAVAETKPEVKPQAVAAPTPAVIPVTETKTEGTPGTSQAQEPTKPKTNDQTHVLTTSAFKALKSKAEEKGRREAMEEIARALQASGFKTIDELAAAVKASQQAQAQAAQQTQQAQPTPAPIPQPPAPPQPAAPQINHVVEAELRKAQRESQRLTQALEAEKAKAVQEVNRRKQLTKKIEAMEIDQELRESAIKAGVRDVDYTMTLLQRELNSKSEEELKTFDENKYYAGLRTTHGYLFGERQEPANTGLPQNNAPAPAPNVRQTQTQVANQVGHKDANKEQVNTVQARIKELGLTYPSS